ncbi:M20 family metallopeptidase [Paenibacillus sp. Marseille-Q4541]|uniref:M20 family metallopeptidase n=1 Tax=Paenibacillus sp. Marseille-Q4541 TaxID=2831522 RepID=UPI001BACC33F|nr:M20 family metallopeptidase [Paenibacillus sp. Marseille-Q4541]
MKTNATFSKGNNIVSDSLEQQIIHWRRHFHSNPELSFQETETSKYVYETLEQFPNLELSKPTPTSVMARLIGNSPGKVLALRADMDALPIVEENDFPFASVNPGVMHACGHDGHTAMLLGVAQILSQRVDSLKGEIRFIFQHAEEELPGGAQEMVKAGVMEGVDYVVGSHLDSGLPTGQIGIVYGPAMASPDSFSLTITGKGGHAAAPHLTVDPIAVGAQVVTNLQHIVSRNVDPLDQIVISVTKFISGSAFNVIPGSAELAGTVRSFDPTVRKTVPELFHRILRGITEAHGAEYSLEFKHGYHPVINEEATTKVVEEAVLELFGQEHIEYIRPSMGGEDFSAYQREAPGVFFKVGSRNEEQGIIYPHHHAKFSIDEDALAIGVQVFIRTAEKLLEWEI